MFNARGDYGEGKKGGKGVWFNIISANGWRGSCRRRRGLTDGTTRSRCRRCCRRDRRRQCSGNCGIQACEAVGGSDQAVGHESSDQEESQESRQEKCRGQSGDEENTREVPYREEEES